MHIFVRLIRLTDVQTFSLRIRKKFVIILSLMIPPHLKCVATLTVNVLQQQLKTTTSVATHFKKLTTGNNVFIVSGFV